MNYLEQLSKRAQTAREKYGSAPFGNLAETEKAVEELLLIVKGLIEVIIEQQD